MNDLLACNLLRCGCQCPVHLRHPNEAMGKLWSVFGLTLHSSCVNRRECGEHSSHVLCYGFRRLQRVKGGDEWLLGVRECFPLPHLLIEQFCGCVRNVLPPAPQPLTQYLMRRRAIE